MSRLAEVQTAFAAALVDPARPAPQGIRRQVDLAQSRRFDVYRNNMMVSLIEALEASFPAVSRLVGAGFFKAAARAYVRRHPPGSPVLLFYGETFGDFLETFEPAKAVPYLGDVARLEWARIKAYHASDAAALPVSRLASLSESSLEHVTFSLHPSLSLLCSRYPVASLWAATGGADPSADIDMRRGEAVAILRPVLEVDVHVLPPGGYDFIAALGKGADLGSAASAAAAACDDFDLAAHLAGLFELGAVAGIHAPDTESQ